MDPRERYHDPEELLRMFGDGLKLGLWTALPCIVVSFDAATCTCVLEAAVKGQTVDGQGNQTLVDLPLMLDVPVHCYRGGDFSMTFPITAGDEALAIFASRNPDGWWQNGGVQREPVFRGNTLSDAFAFVGPFSQKTKISGWSMTSVQLRHKDGATYVEIDAGKNVNVVTEAGANVTAQSDVVLNSIGGKIEATSPTEINLTAPTINLNGVVVASSTIAAAGGVTSNGGTHSVGSHHHTGVQTGSGNTGGPVG